MCEPRRRILVGLAVLALAGCASTPLTTEPQVVEVRRGGDDGLTLRLKSAVKDELRRRPGVRLAETAGEGQVILWINQARPQRFGRFRARAELTPHGGASVSVRKTCAQQDVPACAARLVSSFRSLSKTRR